MGVASSVSLNQLLKSNLTANDHGTGKRRSRPNLLKEMEACRRELAIIVKAVKTFGILVNLVITGSFGAAAATAEPNADLPSLTIHLVGEGRVHPKARKSD